MPIQNASDSQKVDFLWKKIVYGAAKTDIAGNIDATQEPVASPLQIRADKILQDSASIPAVIPGSNSSVVTIYPTTFPVECISTAGIPTPTLTWQTGQTFWVPPEFGSTYQVKVYIAPSGNAANVASKGTQVFATGSGSNDLWVFDYQSGILNFNSNNTPYSGGSPISFSGNSVYVSGAVYSGKFGLGNLTYVGANITANTDITISTSNNANIFLSAGGSGIVHIQGTDAFGIPSGNILARPTDPDVGYLRFNTELALLEYWNGSAWIFDSPAEITSQIINPDGTSNTYVLTSNATTAGVIVNINGTVQQPFTAYNVVGNTNIVFTEIPLTTDTVEVRTIATGVVAIDGLTFNDTRVYLDAANVNITGNLLPSANVTYDLGSSTLRWRTGYFSANTINIGGGTIGLHETLGFTFTTPGGTPQYMMPNGASTSNTFTSSTVTIQGNLAVAGNTIVTGNVSGQYILGSAQFLTGLPVEYSNVNTKSYTESMGFANYSNVNVSAYTQTQSYTNYSNVNVAAFVTTNGLTNYSNVNVAAYTQTQSYTNYSNVNLSAYLGGAVTIGGNLVVQGNLFVNGNLTTINANNLTINDSIIYLADDNPADTIDIGFVSSFTSAVRYQHTGFVRDATDGIWKLFANVVPEPTTTIDFTNANYSTLQVGNINVLGASGGLINSSGNILATGGIFNALTVNGATTQAGTLTVSSGFINSVGNVVATGGIFNALTVNGVLTMGANINASGDWIVASTLNVEGNVMAKAGTFNGISLTGDIVPQANASSSLGSASNRMNVVYAVTVNGLSVNANYADLAEKYLSDASYSPGTVVDFGGPAEVTKSTDDMSTRIAGVISTNPGYVMNDGLQGSYVVILALVGRVPTKVIGPIKKGDMLVSNGDGRARAELFPRIGSVIGKALEDFNGQDGTIEVVVGIR